MSARPKLEVADVIRGHGEAYRRWRGGKLSSEEAYVLRSLAACRKEDFFLPVRVLSAVFRGKFLDGLKRAFIEGKLTFHGRVAELAQPAAFHGLVPECYRRKWVVYNAITT